MFDEEESQERIGRNHPRQRQERNGAECGREAASKATHCHDTRKTIAEETLLDTDLS
jgi:hypothetical protein